MAFDGVTAAPRVGRIEETAERTALEQLTGANELAEHLRACGAELLDLVKGLAASALG